MNRRAATVGFEDLSTLARCLEHALARAQGHQVADPTLFQRAADEIRRLLHQFAAGFLKEADAGLLAELQAFEPGAVLPDSHADSDEGLLAMSLEEVSTAALPAHLLVDHTAEPALPTSHYAFHQAAEATADDFDFSQPDQIEPELMPIFEEEAEDLLGELHGALREWATQPADTGRAAACMRVLHTFKGGARLAGAMRLGEQAHRLESQIEHLLADGEPGYEQLLALPGIGPWTVAYWRLRCGLDTDAFPASDLVLQKALGGGARLPVKEMTVRSAPWQPWRAYAASWLWHAMSEQPALLTRPTQTQDEEKSP